ncbi:CgeB family protein [Sphingomonas sp.]|uniref:CgeB family protein n=1 Tax=Sphingomonas sp. TaxID=28214 RepID=UPI002B9E7224|nr:glycosyltransferase [Sphingomonas sp.]HTG38933.1 glycosyltransferase [Sphingomonas sp.]
MKIAFYGSSILSAYWNGAATYYRGILSDLARRGHAITFYEPDAFDRQQHRDIDPPDWLRSVVYPATPEGLRSVLDEAGNADVVVKANGVGVFDTELLAGIISESRAGALRIFWDVDAAETLAEMRRTDDHPVRAALPRLDAVFTYGGGEPVIAAYRDFGARQCVPVYNALDPETHFPVASDPRFTCDLGFLGNRLPDRDARVAAFLFDAARRTPGRRYLLGGAGWDHVDLPSNITRLGHVSTRDHNAFNATPLAVLNVARDAMAANGFSPATRVFEAAGAAACLITDAWEGIELFLQPEAEVLVARDGQDVAALLAALTPERAQAVGQAALARVRAEHTYAQRGALVHTLLAEMAAARQVTA